MPTYLADDTSEALSVDQQSKRRKADSQPVLSIDCSNKGEDHVDANMSNDGSMVASNVEGDGSDVIEDDEQSKRRRTESQPVSSLALPPVPVITTATRATLKVKAGDLLVRKCNQGDPLDHLEAAMIGGADENGITKLVSCTDGDAERSNQNNNNVGLTASDEDANKNKEGGEGGQNNGSNNNEDGKTNKEVEDEDESNGSASGKNVNNNNGSDKLRNEVYVQVEEWKCAYPGCAAHGDSIKQRCFICANQYHSHCKTNYNELPRAPGGWGVCFDCQPSQNNVVKPYAKLDELILRCLAMCNVSLLTNINNTTDKLETIVRKWVESYAAIRGHPSLLGFLGGYQSPHDVPRPVTETNVIKIFSDIRKELKTIVPFLHFHVEGFKKEFNAMLAIFDSSGECGQAHVIKNSENEATDKDKKKASKGKEKKMFVYPEDERIECQCCSGKFVPPFPPLELQNVKSTSIALFRSNTVVKGSTTSWKHHDANVYAHPIKKPIHLTKWNSFDVGDNKLLTPRGVGMAFQSMTMTALITSYVVMLDDVQITRAYNYFVKNCLQLTKASSGTSTENAKDSAEDSVSSSTLQDTFFTVFKTHVAMKETTVQKAQDAWNNGTAKKSVKQLQTDTPVNWEYLEQFLTEWKKDVFTSVRYVMLALTGKKLKPIDFEDEEKDFIDAPGTGTGLGLCNNVDTNINRITNLFMTNLFDASNERLSQALQNNFAGDVLKQMLDGAKEMREPFERKAKTMAKLIHFHYLDVKKFVKEGLNMTVKD